MKTPTIALARTAAPATATVPALVLATARAREAGGPPALHAARALALAHVRALARSIALALAFFAVLPAARAETVNAQVMADFNDCPNNTLNDSANDGNSTGLAGDRWDSGSGVVKVTNGDLTPPSDTGYAIVQSSVTPRSLYQMYANGFRQQCRALVNPLSGEVWGSFLVLNRNESQSAGLTFNLSSTLGDAAETTSTQGVRWLYAKGSSLLVRADTYSAEPAVSIPNVFPIDEAALVLFRYDTVGKRLTIWVNPTLTAAAADMDAVAPVFDSGVTPFDLFGSTERLDRIGVVFASGTTTATDSNKLDALRLDASAHAYYAVTGLDIPPDFPRAPVVQDFNDGSIHTLINATATPNNNLTGTGFTGTWGGGSSVPGVTNTDLVASATTRYAITQTGNPRSLWGNYADVATIRAAWRPLATPLSGTVWGSFLVCNYDEEDRRGLTFNNTNGTVSESGGTSVRWLYAKGTDLLIRSSTQGDTRTVAGVFTLRNTALVLFSYDTTALRLRVWVNPELQDNVEGMASIEPAYDSEGTQFDLFGTAFAGALGQLGVLVNGGKSGAQNAPAPAEAATLDAIYLASGSAGYYAVTGLVAKPRITSQPESQTLLPGDPATFAVSATSQWPLLYQWTHGGTAIASATTATLTIPAIGADDAGAYQVLVSHDGGIGSTLSAQASLILGTPDAPGITSGPTFSPSGTIGVGDSVSIAISATGTEPLTYQWFHSGTSIPSALNTSATTATLSLASATLADAGDYFVVVDNLANNPLTSGTVTLAVADIPNITGQPAPATVLKGTSPTFTVTADCASSMSYQWFHGVTAISSALNTSATTAILSLDSVTEADAGNYSVLVANAAYPDYSVTSSPAALTVNLIDMEDAPVIADFNDCAAGQLGSGNSTTNDNKGIGFSSAKWDGSANATNNNSFTSVIYVSSDEDLAVPQETGYAVVQSGPPRSVYGANSSPANIRGAWRTLAASLSGEVWGSFLVKNTHEDHQTGITFNLFGGGGAVPAKARWLAAKGRDLLIYSNTTDDEHTVPGVFTLETTALVLFSYDTAAQRLRVWVDPRLPDTAAALATLAPDFDSGTGTPFNLFGSEFSGALGRIGIVINGGPGQSNQTNTAPIANKLDSLRLSSGANGYYHVTGKAIAPVILTQPESRLVNVGDTATFTVSATGLGELGYQWYHAGALISSATGSSYTISPVAYPTDGGEYEVEVFHRNGNGAARSEPAILAFRADLPPLIITGGPDLLPSSTAGVSGTVSMVISASGTPPYTYQWFRNGTAITSATTTSATTATHTLDPVTLADAGDYHATVNDLKADLLTSGTVTLTVVDIPDITGQPEAATVYKSESVTFTVTATCSSQISYQWYHNGTLIPSATTDTLALASVAEADAGNYFVRVANAAYPDYYADSSPATLTVNLIDSVNAPVIVDFNDIPLAGRSNLGSSSYNNSTSIGFSSPNWAGGTSLFHVSNDDLVAPTDTGYAIVQPPAVRPGYVWGKNKDRSQAASVRHLHRELAAPLSGTVWGSFLVNNPTAGHRTGLTFNVNTGFDDNAETNSSYNKRWLYARGTSLVVRSGSGEEVADVPAFTIKETALVVFSYDTAAQRLRVWVNPALADTAEGMDSVPLAYDSGAAQLDLFGADYSGALGRLGLIVNGVGTEGTDTAEFSGKLDSIRLSSGTDGYYHVTGKAVPPVILTQPASQVVAFDPPGTGEPALFTVSATGLGPLAYQWRHSGTDILTGTTATLAVSRANRDNGGWYEVQVSHAAGTGSVLSESAALIFDDEKVNLEVLSLQLVPSSTVHTGTAVSMIVSATGTEPLAYQWLKDGADIAGATSATYAIDPVEPADSGAYSVRLNDLAGVPLDSAPLTLAVLGPPIILEQPASQTVAGATTARLAVSATSVSPLAYQWFRDGAEIPGATDAALDLPDVQLADAGDYTVKVLNADYPEQYFTFSTTATLTILPTDRGEAPVVADFNDYAVGNLNGAANDGKGIGFEGDRWSSGSAAVQVAEGDLDAPASTRYGAVQPVEAPFAPRSLWLNYAAGTRQQLRALASPLSGAVWGSFLVRNLAEDQIAGLTFNVSGALGDNAETTAASWLYARGRALVVRAADRSESVAPGVFTLGETALVVFSYDTAAKKLDIWVNPVLADDARAFTATVPPTLTSGAAPLDLFGLDNRLATIGVVFASRVTAIASANRLDALRLASGASGYYHVTGMAVPPVILEQPAARTIVERGAPVTLAVSATSTAPILYQWTFWDAPIPGATGASLTLPAVQDADQGKYRVIVRNSGGSASTTSALAVVLVRENLVNLAITRQPALHPSTVPDGSPVSLSVAATGTPPLEYQWRKNGAPIPGATTGELSLPAARVADSGAYDVEITDLSREKITSAAVPLRVQIPPSILTPPQDAVSYQGGPASFVVEAEGTDITYQWKRNGAPIPAPQGTAGATLALAALTAADHGASYTVVVANGVGSVESAPATLTLKDSTPPGANGVARPAADAAVAGGAQAADNLDRTGLSVAAFDTARARKSYLLFDLPLAVESADATAASLTLTLGGAPFINGGTGAMHPRNPVRLRLHGLIDNAPAWAENTLTWTDAPARADSATAPGPGTVPLAETTVDVATRLAGDTVTFADPRLAQFLNWAAGRRGDLYGNGHAGDTDHRLTLVLTSIDEGADFAGVRFADKETGERSAPLLVFDTTPAPAPALENDRYAVALAADLGVEVTDKDTGATAHFAAAFEVLYNTGDPGLTTTQAITDAAATNITLPSWKTDLPALAELPGNRAHDYGAATGTRTALTPVRASIADGRILWRFAPSDTAIAGFHAALELPAGAAPPRLRWTLAPAGARHYAVSFTGLPEVPNTDIDAFYMPGVWDGRRFPSKQYVIDEIRSTTPAVLRKLAGQTVVAGAAVDPFEIPARVSTRYNGLFGLCATDFTATQSLPAIAAPLYGGAGSRTDGTLSFSVRLIVRDGTLDAALRDVVTGVYGFRDYRSNLAGGSLNTALDNLMDFLLDETVDPRDGLPKGYSYWRANEKANEYVNDNPDTVRFQSAAAALGLALVRDDADYYEKRALPTIEYFVSRSKDAMVFTGTGAVAPLGGPLASYYATDYFALSALTGGRTSAYATLAGQSWTQAVSADSTFTDKTLLGAIGAGATLTRLQVLGDDAHRGGWSFKLWHSLIAGYKATGQAEYLADARTLADAYIKYRYTAGPATDFADVANSFWNQIGGRWESLLEMSELAAAAGDDAGAATYAEHAAKAMDEFIRHIQFAPALNEFNVDGHSVTHPAIRSSLVSEVGLTSEASASSVSHRGIFMSAYAAPSLMRVAALTADPFYAAVGRSGIIGRWLNYPGYTIRNEYRAGQLTAAWPLRWYGIDPDYKGNAVTAHMNHPAMLASIAIDFLMADAEYKSLGAVKFPWQFSDSKAYFRGRVFGGAPGVFYGESGVWPWLPRGLVTLSGENAVQLNYVAGHGNGRLYLAFSNQSATEVTATVTVRADKVNLAPGARMTLWRDNVPQNPGAFTNGATTVTVSPGGFTAIAIDDAAPALGLQADYRHGHGDDLPEESFSQRDDPTLERVTGMVLSLSPSRQNAYIYVASGTGVLQSATLTYSIDGGPEQTTPVKNAFPFEFSVPLPPDAQQFAYTLSGVPAAAGPAVDVSDTLYLVSPPRITRQPAAAQSSTAGEAVLFTVETNDPDGHHYTYQWFKSGSPDEPIPGATAASYGFLCTTADDGNEYYVAVTKGRIRLESNRATLTVSPTPDVLITTNVPGSAVTLDEGASHTLAIVAQNADGYQWFKDGAPIPGAVSDSLLLAGAAYEAGDYYVVAYGLVNGARGSVLSATVTVNINPSTPGAPAITTQPQGRAAPAGTAFALSVVATGAASYQWYHNGAALDGEISPVLNLSGAWTDNGDYHVVISNPAGSIVSRRVVVSILPGSANIIEQPADSIVRHGVPSALTVTVAGEAQFQWRKDGVPIPGAIYPALTLSGSPAEAGVYDVVITTSAGDIISAPATVTIAPAPDSHFAHSSALATDASGTLYVADASRHVIQALSPGQNLATFAGTLDSPGALDGLGLAAKFNTPSGLAARSGTLYVADTGNNSIRAVTLATSRVSTLLSGTPSDPAQQHSQLTALAVDAEGTLYVADTGRHVILRVNASGSVATLAGMADHSGTTSAGGTLAQFNAPAGLALLETAGAGALLYVADTGNHTIRVIDLASNEVTTIAGRPETAGSEDGTGSDALLNAPRGLVLEDGDLYFVDTGNSLVRKLSSGTIATLAGYPGIGAMPGVPGFKDGAGSDAWFAHPEALALAPDGTLYVADTGNKAIRAIDASDNVTTLTVTATTGGDTTPPPSGGTGGGGGASSGGGGGIPTLWALALLTLALTARRLRAP